MAPAFTWTGFYVGANLGYAWQDNELSVLDHGFVDLPRGYRKENGGFIAGVQAGYNYQINSFVLGVEGDLNYASMRTRIGDTFAVTSNIGNGSYSYEAGSKVDWYGTLRARVGFTPTERLLIYGTGGLAFGGVKTKASDSFNTGAATMGSFGKGDDTRFGWTLGLGGEYAITQNIIARLEYSYVSLADEDQRLGVGVFAPNSNGFTVKDDPSFQVLRAGVNYKF